MPVLDTVNRIGTFVACGEEDAKYIPFYLIDYGPTHPAVESVILRNRVISLDIIPEGANCTFHVTGSRTMSEVTPELISRALAAPDALRKEVLFGQGHPEFASSCTFSLESCKEFIQARNAFLGSWLLVILSEGGMQIAISPTGEIMNVQTCSRAELEFLLE